MKALFLRVNGQWLCVQKNDKGQIPVQLNDLPENIDAKDFRRALTTKNVQKINEVSLYLPMELISLIEDPNMIKDAFCDLKISSKASTVYEITVAIECYMEALHEGCTLDAKSFVKTLEELKEIEQKEGEAFCSFFKFLQENEIFNFKQLHYYGDGYNEISALATFAIDCVSDKFNLGHNIYFDELIATAQNIVFHDEHHPEHYMFATDSEREYFTSTMIRRYGEDLENAPLDVCETFRCCMKQMCEVWDSYGLDYVGRKAITYGNRVVKKDEALGESYLLTLIENAENEEYANAKVACELLGDLYARDSSIGSADYDKAYKYYSMASTLGSVKGDYRIFSLSLKDLIPHAPFTLFNVYLKKIKQHLKDTDYVACESANKDAAYILECLGDERVEKGNTIAIACYDSVKHQYYLEALQYYLEAKLQIDILQGSMFDFDLAALDMELDEKIANVKDELAHVCKQEKITFKANELFKIFDHIPEFIETSTEPFEFSYNKNTHEIRIYTDSESYAKEWELEFKFLCSVPECSFCDYVKQVHLYTDELNIVKTDNVYDEDDLIEFNFDSIKGNDFMYGDIVIATIDSEFIFDAKVQTLKCKEETYQK